MHPMLAVWSTLRNNIFGKSWSSEYFSEVWDFLSYNNYEMKTILLAVGRTQDRRFQEIIDEYAARLRHYLPFEMQAIPELRQTRNLSEAEQKEREAELIRRALQPGDYIVLLDEHGRERRSLEFAAWMQKRMAASPRRLVLVIGGPYGFAPSIHSLANEEISLSQMTLSHQMIRLLIVEQLYRAMTILAGEPYHHE